MIRYSRPRLSLFSAIKTTFLETSRYVSYVVNEQAKAQVNSVSKIFDFLKGKSLNDDDATAEKRKRHKEMYNAILRQQAIKLQEDNERYKSELKKLGTIERLKVHWNDLRQSIQGVTSTKAGVMQLLQHCAASHAAEIAIEEDIDVKDVQFVLEKRQASNSIAQEATVVGYIDAPNASEEEFAMFVEKIQKACPVAKRMTIEWRNCATADRDRRMEFRPQWPGVGTAASYPFNLREEIVSKGDEKDDDSEKLSSNLQHEGMSFRNSTDFQAKHSPSENVEREVSEPVNRQEKVNHTTETELRSQGEQQQTESEAHVPHGTPGEHRMHSTGNDVKNPSNSNLEEGSTAKGDKNK